MTAVAAPPKPTLPLDSRTAAAAVTILFAVNGLLLGGYGGSLP